MIRTGEEYKASIRDSRAVYMNGERIKDVTVHPAFKPLVDIRARIYDLQHDPETRHLMTYREDGEVHAINNKLPLSQQDWWDKRRATDTVLEDIGGVVTRVGDEPVGEMWSLFDGQDVLNEVDPQFSKNIRNHIFKVLHTDPFHVSANTDPKGDRSKAPQDQDPDMLLHVVKETDAGIGLLDDMQQHVRILVLRRLRTIALGIGVRRDVKGIGVKNLEDMVTDVLRE